MTLNPHVSVWREHAAVAALVRRRIGAGGALRALASTAALALLGGPWAASPVDAQTKSAFEVSAEPTEYEVKAVVLQRFALTYVKWPDTAFASATAPFVVAVLGRDPFGKLLDEAFAGKKVGEHPVKVVRYASIDDLEPCHMLFVTRAQEKHLKKIQETYKDKSTLLVAESLSAAENGAQIGIYLEQSRLRFAINPATAKQAKLEISSELLKLAKLIGVKSEGDR